tara:strand:- start:5248 stop:5550 length:303 start_codon:yes stop_codon:yes gene_type:complete
MEDNKYFYEAEYKSQGFRIQSLERQLTEAQEKLNKQDMLLEEMYKLIYHKRAWLSLSDENIRGMQEVIGRLPLSEEEGSVYPNLMPRTADEFDDNDPWGI